VPEEEFFSFNEALDQLRLKEEELKRLVSEGEIRAFREGDTMRLRREDVETLRGELQGGDVVDLEDAGEDMIFEDVVSPEEAGMATEEITDMDTLLDDDIEELEIVEDVVEEVSAAGDGVRRSSAVAQARARTEMTDETEPVWARAVMILSAVILFLAIPVALSISSGQASEMAKSIAGIFGKEFAG